MIEVPTAGNLFSSTEHPMSVSIWRNHAMAQPSKTFVNIVGASAVGTGILLMLMAVAMFAAKMPARQCSITGLSSFIPFLMAVACYEPKRRTIALRILGSMACCALSVTLVLGLLGYGPKGHAGGFMIGRHITAIIACGGIALKGRWPGADDEDAGGDDGAAGATVP